MKRRGSSSYSESDSDANMSCHSEGSRVSFDPAPSDTEVGNTGLCSLLPFCSKIGKSYAATRSFCVFCWNLYNKQLFLELFLLVLMLMLIVLLLFVQLFAAWHLKCCMPHNFYLICTFVCPISSSHKYMYMDLRIGLLAALFVNILGCVRYTYTSLYV